MNEKEMIINLRRELYEYLNTTYIILSLNYLAVKYPGLLVPPSI